MSKFINIIIFLGFIAVVSLSSCFTGVESTKKITLSRDDKRAIRPSQEEEFFQPVAGIPLEKWEKHRPFVSADNRVLLIFDPEGLPTDPDAANLGGKTFLYEGVEKKMSPDGSDHAVVVFSCNGTLYKFDSGKEYNEAPELLTSEKLPMLVDISMVQSANELLNNRKLWIKSALWYDDKGNRIPGLKFVPVTVRHIQPGTVAFPMKVLFTAPDGSDAWAYMNFGHSGKDSRSFANLFSLSDIRAAHPAITDENWAKITQSNVTFGMTKEECKLALGNPTEVDSGRDYSQTIDVWHYSDGAVLWFEDGLLSRFRK